MKKIILKITLSVIVVPVTAQILYIDVCKVPCNLCKPDPMKVEYKADASKQIVMRIIDEKDVDVVADCTVLDKSNWSCDGNGPMRSYGKQYSANGIAYWNDSKPMPEYDKQYGKSYTCIYEKNLLGQLKLRK